MAHISLVADSNSTILGNGEEIMISQAWYFRIGYIFQLPARVMNYIGIAIHCRYYRLSVYYYLNCWLLLGVETQFNFVYASRLHLHTVVAWYIAEVVGKGVDAFIVPGHQVASFQTTWSPQPSSYHILWAQHLIDGSLFLTKLLHLIFQPLLSLTNNSRGLCNSDKFSPLPFKLLHLQPIVDFPLQIPKLLLMQLQLDMTLLIILLNQHTNTHHFLINL